MANIILSGFILVPEADLDIVTLALLEHTRLTRQEPGCICFEVKPNQDNPLRFDVYEEFVDQAAFDLHQQRVKASHWGTVTVNVSRHYQITSNPD